MQHLGLNEIRERYLRFFQSKGHLRLPSFSLVPENDKSLLLIPAGMAPLKPYFTGEQTPPAPRVTTCQKCIRTNDIENVGVTARHLTFFEMLGNFSFGDYFKPEACAWAWEFVTKELAMPIDRLHVSIYELDDEALDIWTKDVGVAPSHVFRMGKKDNFWEIGTGSGPCGPCSEIYFDRGEKYACGPDCRPGCDCDRYVEFWNLVFTQFENDGNNNYLPLAKKNIDTGMGLERIACIMQEVDSLFEIDTMQAITGSVCDLAGVRVGASAKTDVSLRIITDHLRSTVMLVSDGVAPANEGRGYVLRRLLRRAARHGKLLGIKGQFLADLCDVVVELSGAAYPELAEKRDFIRQVIRMEEERFDKTIDAGLKLLSEQIAAMKQAEKSVMDGAEAFRLYDTFGFPLDLTVEILAEQGLGVDQDGFDAEMDRQRQRARSDRKSSGNLGWAGEENPLEGLPATVFDGYDATEGQGTVLAIVQDGHLQHSASAPAKVTVLLDRSTFYGESGGQVGDTGRLTGPEGLEITVSGAQKTPEQQILHIGELKSGKIKVGDRVEALVDESRRRAIMRAHSSVHLLHAALRKVLGSHVQQAGSLVEPDRARFDFSHFAGLTEEEKSQVERLVNEQILAGIAGSVQEMSMDEARTYGAVALFGEKYGERVRVVRFGDWSCELCGGTHLDNAAKVGLFRIVSEGSVAAGVRRIEAVTGAGVLSLLARHEEALARTAQALHANPAELEHAAIQAAAQLKEQGRQIESLRGKIAAAQVESLLAKSADVGGLRLVALKLSVPAEELRLLGDALRDTAPESVALLAAVSDGRVTLSAACGAQAVKRGAHAGNLVKAAAKTLGGNGGGRPDSASAGGRDPEKLPQALAEAAENLRSMLKN